MAGTLTILITGAKGFIGKNLATELTNRGYQNLLLCDQETTAEELKDFTRCCDFVFHLAGVNRSEQVEEFMEGNADFTSNLLRLLEETGRKVPVLLSSSIQAELDNPYGVSKRTAEEAVQAYGETQNCPVSIYRLSNVFGKWCRPNYNSVVATFCHNITHDLPITIHNPETRLELVYIDDVVEEFISCMEEIVEIVSEGDVSKKEDSENKNMLGLGYQKKFRWNIGTKRMVPVWHSITLQELADKLYFFHESRKTLEIPNMSDTLEKKLYSTYLSYLPEDGFSYPLKMNVDERGSFTEILRTGDRGQVSVNIAKPGITKGNHWHHTKNEKFLVVKGEGLIQFRKVGTEEVIEYRVSGEKLEVVDIPTGYTHNIINVGTEDLVTVMWANEVFDLKKPDTWYMKV